MNSDTLILSKKLIEDLPRDLLNSIADLSDDEIWDRPNIDSNSIGNIILHVSGGLMEYVVQRLGGHQYVRNREQEFSKQKTIPKTELVSQFLDVIEKVRMTLNSVPEPTGPAFQTLIAATLHFSYHVGQIVYIAQVARRNR